GGDAVEDELFASGGRSARVRGPSGGRRLSGRLLAGGRRGHAGLRREPTAREAPRRSCRLPPEAIMSESPAPGSIVWQDLTVSDAAGVRDFYAAVAGWTPEAVPVAGYEDYTVSDASGKVVAGICHARGSNDRVPA